MPKLNEQQKRFAESYIKTMDAGRSAIEAGYSEHSCASQGSQLLKKPQVKAYIKELSDNIKEKTFVEVDEIIQALRLIAFAGKETKTTNSDRLRALELLGKTLALYTESHAFENTVPEEKERTPEEQEMFEDFARQYKLRMSQPQKEAM